MSTKKPTTKPSQADDHMKRTNFFMPPELRAGLEKMVKTHGGSQADHVRRAVHHYLKRYRLIDGEAPELSNR